MGLRIRTNVSALQSQRNLENTTRDLSDNIEKLSSGYRINKSADDAAGLAITDTLEAKIRSTGQAKRNASDGVSMIQVAEGSMNEITNILVRLRELATQSATDTLGNLERSYTNKEYTQLVEEIDRIANATEFNGVKLLGGGGNNDGLDELVFHISAGNGAAENTDTINLNIEQIKVESADVLGLGKDAEVGPLDPDGDFDRQDAADKLDVLDVAIKRIAGNKAILGAKQSRLNSTIRNIGVQMETMETAKSRIKDTDFAGETAKYTQNNILSQAGSSVLSQANNQSQLALALIR